MTERIKANVRGRVQGVGFRWFVARQAERLGLRGFTANQADGSVLVVAEGDADSLARLLAALRDGPPGAEVDDVSHQALPATGEFGAFQIRAGAHRGD